MVKQRYASNPFWKVGFRSDNSHRTKYGWFSAVPAPLLLPYPCDRSPSPSNRMALWIAKTHRPARDSSYADNRRAMPDLFEENKKFNEIQFSAPLEVR